MSQSGTPKWWRRSTATFLIAACLAVGAVGFRAPSAAATPAHAHATVPVREINKEVLSETSIDGPAFSSLSDYVPNPDTHPANTYPASAWTGTDAYHSLLTISKPRMMW